MSLEVKLGCFSHILYITWEIRNSQCAILKPIIKTCACYYEWLICERRLELAAAQKGSFMTLTHRPSFSAAPFSVIVFTKMPSFSKPWSAPTPIPMMLIPSPLSPGGRKIVQILKCGCKQTSSILWLHMLTLCVLGFERYCLLISHLKILSAT